MYKHHNIIILYIILIIFCIPSESMGYNNINNTEQGLEPIEPLRILTKSVPETEIPDNKYNLSDSDKYLLAKIAMAEAEGQSIETKAMVIASILNRVESEDFPDSISEIIFQNSGKIYQYSPVIPNGRWYQVEPNSDCYKALNLVLNSDYDISNGATYFESCSGDSWHSHNLTYLFQNENIRFYK